MYCCIRVRSLGVVYEVRGLPVNQFYGSPTEKDAEKEIDQFWPLKQTICIIKPSAYIHKGVCPLPI